MPFLTRERPSCTENQRENIYLKRTTSSANGQKFSKTAWLHMKPERINATSATCLGKAFFMVSGAILFWGVGRGDYRECMGF